MRRILSLIHKPFMLFTLASALACGGGGAPGTGPAGPAGPAGTAPSLDGFTTQRAAGPSAVGDVANVPMPDVAVGPSTDIQTDKPPPAVSWRVLGGGVAVCVSTEDPFARLNMAPSLLMIGRSLQNWLLIPNAYASNEPSNSVSNYGNLGSQINLLPQTEIDYSHFLKASLHGQIQYKVEDGDFQNWKSENFEGERYLRVATASNSYRDALISADGKIEIPIIFSFTSSPTLDNFIWQMDHLTIYRTQADFNLTAKAEQKECPPASFCFMDKFFRKIGPMIADAPQFGAQPDFSTLPTCGTDYN